jgi:hypothetical protein
VNGYLRQGVDELAGLEQSIERLGKIFDGLENPF